MEAVFLRVGDEGSLVAQLQQALLEAGFNPGRIDGQYGGGTEAAVLGFQRSKAMLADGVAGPRTQAALGLHKQRQLPDATGAMTLQVASRMCPHTPLGALQQHLPVVLKALQAARVADRWMVLMAVATIRAETESFRPVREGVSRFNTSPNGHDFDLYDFRADLGNGAEGDGARYCGRGFVQLTGRHNYEKYGARLRPRQDLASQPERANDPALAADLLALFLADREMPIKEALVDGDLRRARRLVNGGVHGLERFSDALRTGQALLPV